ncbi:MAG: primosomal protein N', partial [Gammaproteobacteria bacterium]|nr:primosomal protein N' [Gammaproteobacteria bacterium]
MPASPRFISVAVPTPLRSTFQYRLEGGQSVRPGSRVLVPFGHRKLAGVVTGIEEEPNVDNKKIRQVLDVFDDSASLTDPILKLCQWAAGYYDHPIGDVIANALPTLIRKGGNPRDPLNKLHITSAGANADPTVLRRAPAQRQLLANLIDEPLTRGEIKLRRISSRTVKSLIDKDWAEWQQERTEPDQPFELGSVHIPDIEITGEQADAIAAIDDTTPYLLQGITGSGKTEVYLRLMEPLLKAGSQILVLVPEIGLTPQTVARFRDRFDVPLTLLHSSLSDRERALGWMQAKEGSVGIILGTRSAVFTPLLNPGAIIVDEEHDTSYKQQDGFRYSARDLAVLRGQFEQMPVVLGSATPSLESLHNVETGKYRHLQLRKRPPGTVSESYELVDTRHLERREGFTRALRNRIKDQLAIGDQVLVFLNRRGFAPVMMCSDCNWIAHCRRCDAKLTYHLNLNSLVCHHCGSSNHNIISCQACGSNHVAAIGLGTQRIEQTLKEMFPNYPVLRIDRDSTRRQGAMEDFVEQVGSGEPAILVGTQLLSKGHHFPNVTLVALLDIDAGFYSSDFRALEKLGQLILQVGGRAGRAEKPGTVVIQSDFATHPLLQTLITNGYAEFSELLLKERQDLELPPYTFNALIRAEAADSSLAREFLESISDGRKSSPSVDLLGPIPALMEKKAGRFRQILILTSNS